MTQSEHPFLGALAQRMRAELAAKIAVWLGLAVGICVPYFTLQRVDAFPLRTVPVTPLDLWIPFDPRWIWAYASLALLMPLAPLVALRRDQLVRYAKGLTMLCLPCFAIFLLFPVAGPRPELAPQHALYRLIVAMDTSTNSLPSLHAGLVAYSFLFGFQVLRSELGSRARLLYGVVASLWGAAILYSTLATKQHWLIDLPAGALVACIAHALAWRAAERVPRAREASLPAD